jgi:4'-phosphopantetheinyl transferase
MWLPSAHWEPLSQGYVDVWRVPVPLPAGCIPEAAAILTPQEKSRMESFAQADDRNRFLCARSALRRTLSRYLGIGPRDIRFDASENNKPFLALSPAGPGGPEFNLSHSGAWVLIAVGDGPVGVDVEALRSGLEWLKIAKEFFPARLVEEILANPPERRMQAFFLAWTRLEAYLKGLGTGLAERASEYIIGFDTVITNIHPEGSLRESWRVRNLDLDPDHAAALAWKDSCAQIRQWTWAW